MTTSRRFALEVLRQHVVLGRARVQDKAGAHPALAGVQGAGDGSALPRDDPGRPPPPRPRPLLPGSRRPARPPRRRAQLSDVSAAVMSAPRLCQRRGYVSRAVMSAPLRCQRRGYVSTAVTWPSS